jgi:hypothetical protein
VCPNEILHTELQIQAIEICIPMAEEIFLFLILAIHMKLF